MKSWLALGLDENDFWHKTPRQLNRAFEGRRELQIAEHNSRMFAAWHIAALTRAKKMPPLKRVMAKVPKKPQTWQEQLAIARMWAAIDAGKITIPANMDS